jgi:hypothetical protein
VLHCSPLRKILNTTVTTNATSFALQLAVVILVGLSIRWGTLTYVCVSSRFLLASIADSVKGKQDPGFP